MNEEEIRREIALLEKQINVLRSLLAKKALERLAELKAAGWKEFMFVSDYYGSHQEYGEGDIERRYLFHPDVDISSWEGVVFSHGHYDSDTANHAFMDWLETLNSDQYMEVD